MKYTVSLLVASAAIASAQFTIGSNGSIACTGSNPNGVYCAGDSLSTNIIIRCSNGVGQAGNCNDNLAGYFPFGVGGAQCWSSAPNSGIGACAKNCLVQGGSGNSDTFYLPGCVPTYATTISDTFSVSTRTIIDTFSVPSSSATSPVSTRIITDKFPISTPSSSATSLSTVTSTGTSICTTGGTTTTITFTTTYCPSGSLTTSIVAPTTTPYTLTRYSSTYVPTGGPTGSSNGTTTTKTSATPVGPSGITSATPSTYTGGAMANSAGASFAAVGLFIAYFL